MNIFERYSNLGKFERKDKNLEYNPSFNQKENLEDVSEKSEINNLFRYIGVLIIFLIFSFQLFKLQVTKGNENQFLAEDNRLRTEEIKAPRGIIFDKNKKALVKNIPIYNLELVGADLPRDEDARFAVYEKLKEKLGTDFTNQVESIEKEKLLSADPIVLKEDIDREEAMECEVFFHGLSGVGVSVRSTRQYEEVSGLSHILGYIGKISEDELLENSDIYSITDYVGKIGLEYAYENELKGEKGTKNLEVNSAGKVQRELETEEVVPGYDLITSIDIEVQKKAASEVENYIKKLQEEGKDVHHGVVIASNPKNGEIISMVSIPSYDNNLFSQGINQQDYESLINDEEKPMLNRVISGIYPSGSVIKPIVAAAALDKKVVTENTTIDDPGEIKIGDYVFPDWKNHGLVDIRRAIAVSCNVFFYAIGGGWEDIGGLGVELLTQYLDRFGFGKTSGIELSGEESGTIPDPEWKQEVKDESWYLGDTYHLAIGQGDFLVTPLQINNAISAIANNGTSYKPHLVHEIQDKEGNVIKSIEPEILDNNVVDDEYSLQVVREGMLQAVTSSDGSARQLTNLPVSSAGKTGTAQFDGSDLKKTHSWFTGFAPYEDPEIAITVMVENGGDGFDVAEPIAYEVLKTYFENR